MRREGSGIRIYGQKTLTYRTRQKYASVWGIHALSVWLLAAAWWNAFLSVFPAELGSPWLYGSLAFLSAGTVLIHRKAGIRAVPTVLFITGISVWAGRTVFGQFFERIRESWMAMIYPGTVEMSGFPAEFAFGSENMFVLPGEALLGMAGAVVTVPLLELWVIVLRKGKGRIVAGIFMAVPLLAAAAAGYFQTELPTWMLILAAGSYFGVCEQTGGGEKRGQSLRMWIRYLGSAALLCAVVFLAADLGKVLDIGRQDPEGFYQETRAGIRSGIIAPLESFVDNTVLVGTEEEGDGITGQGNADPQRTEEGFGAQSLQTSSAMSDLKGLAYFQPSGAVEQTVRLEEPPSGTVYIAERYGITYTGDSWSDMSEEGLEGQALMQACTSWPDGLDGLESLVSGWETGSLEEISGRIDEELSGLAVYDTSPGPTPADRDFVEYFLFERGSGFCVHFASAAVLLYRMNGFPARYAEGYAVPESAFVLSEDGAYEARIDGTMGHAWCQVYDGESGEWVNMEHTPGSAAAEPLPDGQGQAVTEEETSGAERQSKGVSGDEDQNTDSAEAERQGMLYGENGAPGEMFRVWGLRVMAAAAALMVIFSGVFLQAAVRRSWNRKRFLEEKEGAGITAMYEGIVKTAAFLGCETAGLTERENVGLICGICPEVKREEWIWLYETVMESLFYHLDDGRRKRKRAEMLCRRFQKAAMERMGRGKRLIYRHVCVYTMWK